MLRVGLEKVGRVTENTTPDFFSRLMTELNFTSSDIYKYTILTTFVTHCILHKINIV